ncbi:MAG TPA: tetratricopeptide repeat protein [Thermoanaerobaculia bacterium]|nr:tetratricopeptide repeat protein [Thermoanaerobaculia bacterium]
MIKKIFLLLALTTTMSCVYWTPMSRRPSTTANVIENVPMQKWDIKSCGAGSLSAVLQHHGDTTSMDEWQEKLPKTRGGVMSIDLVLAARSKGFESNLITGDAQMVEAEVRDGRPVILMLQVIQYPGKSLDFFHYVVIDGFDPKRNLFRTQFGDGKARWAPLSRLEGAWKKTRYATIVVRPPDPNAQALRAAVQLEEQGKLALAAHAYREIVQKDPASVLAWTNLGNAEMRLGRRPAAEEAFRKALAIDGEAADTLNNLAWMLYEDKRMEEAEPLARKAAITKAPDPWMRYDTLARILAARGKCDEARSTFEQALAATPENRTAERAEIIAAAASNIPQCSQSARNGPPPSTN